MELVQAHRQPLDHLPLRHGAKAHGAVRRAVTVRQLAVRLLVRRDVGSCGCGSHPRSAASRSRWLPRKHADADAVALVTLHNKLRQGTALVVVAATAHQATPRGARAPARQAEQPEDRAERRLQAPPQRGPREERAAEGRVDAGVDAQPEDEEDGHHHDAARAVRRPRELHQRVDEEARAADAHHVGDGQTVHAEAAVHGAREIDRLASGRA